jgi:hypothetical protein
VVLKQFWTKVIWTKSETYNKKMAEIAATSTPGEVARLNAQVQSLKKEQYKTWLTLAISWINAWGNGVRSRTK